MRKIRVISLRVLGLAFLLVLGVTLVPAFCQLFLSQALDLDGQTPLPKREFLTPIVVNPLMVASTWDYETIFSPQKIEFPSQRWLAVDSKGSPALAYGGSQLNYAWFDGTKWQSEGIDLRPGAGKFAHLLFDAVDQPHIVYASGGYADLSLDIMVRDLQGWRHQTIDPEVCFGRNLDIALDHQDSLVTVYEASQSCDSSSSSNTQIRFASYGQDGWKIETISQNGIFPSITVDRSGQVHISYQDVITNSLIESVLRPGGAWEYETILESASFPAVSRILIDENQRTHIIYSIQDSGVTILNHSWKDENGLQSEQVKTIPSSNGEFTAFMESRGQIYVLVSGDPLSLLRRGPNGWQDIELSGFGTGFISAPTLAMDQRNTLHLAYFTYPQNSINYARRQGEQWQIAEVDRGNGPGNAAMAFNQAGQLHVSFFDTQRVLHYLSKEQVGWRDEVVSEGISSLYPSIELLFDGNDQPHIFFQNDVTNLDGKATNLVHAYHGKNGWVSEIVPVVQPGEFAYRSRFAISPEGWPAFLQRRYLSTHYSIRSTDGWKTELLADIQTSEAPAPQIIFSNRSSPASSSPLDVVPEIFYFDPKANALKYFAPGTSKPLVVPLLAQDEEAVRLAILPSNQEKPLFFLHYKNKSFTQGSEENLRFADNQNRQWRTYQINGIHPPEPFIPTIDSTGLIRIAYLDYNQREQPIYYLSGSGSDWKKSMITGLRDHPWEKGLLSTALGANGQYCILISDTRANALVLGCLESLQ